MATLISSFYNEEYLLPWWLEHHKGMFEHGVIINNHSTDTSVEITKKICPTWEVRDTKLKVWGLADSDEEMMGVEREFDGYKTILTTTEFLMGVPYLPSDPTALAIPMIRMADNEPDKKPTYDRPLVEQKHFGFADRSANKYRYLHNHPDGRYGLGRHRTEHKITVSSNWIYKYVFSPWTEELVKRKMQMKATMSAEDSQIGRAGHHFWDRNKLEKKHKYALRRSSNI